MTPGQREHLQDLASTGLVNAAAKAYAAAQYDDVRCLEEAISSAETHLRVLRETL